jgi:hypothetical protein
MPTGTASEKPMRRVALTAAVLFAAAAVLLSTRGEKQSPNSAAPVSALIVAEGTVSAEDVEHPNAVRISDPKTLARLESFFPDYRDRPSSEVARGWEVGHNVYFDFPQGVTIRIAVSENQNAAFWTAGRGDFRTHGDFKAFVDAL